MTAQKLDQKSPTHPDSRASESESNPVGKILHAAWLAIVLGLSMEVLLLLANGMGDVLGLKTVVADLVKNVSWSIFVCVGLAIGKTISRIQIPMMGLLGFLSAPTAFEISRVLHKGTLEALSVGGADPTGPSPLLLALIKALEYGCLGLALGWIGGRAWGGAMAHVAVGLLVGIVFGGTIVGLEYGAMPGGASMAELLPRATIELLFPVGCSLVLFAAGVLGDKANRAQRSE
ncbi:MAG: hypothetical protein ACRDTR_22060 [Rubrobacter sp.]